tara:strand:- start:810 stop:1274 length:465 start_codon:yes stop_codon:yes gene_type:complete
MTIPSSGSFKASDLNLELNRPSSAQLKASDTALRELAGDTSGQYEASDFRGKSYFTFSVPNTSKFVNQPDPGYYYLSVVCPVTGGASPISYSYSLSNGTITIQGQNGNTVTLRAYLTNGTGTRTATLTATATDANGEQITDSGSVSISYEVGGF